MEQYQDMLDRIDKLNERITACCVELANTQSLIRQYNGLRSRLDECERVVNHMCGQMAGAKDGSRDTWGYVVGAIGLLFGLVQLLNK